jgi:SAM-dependent methyltransferase
MTVPDALPQADGLHARALAAFDGGDASEAEDLLRRAVLDDLDLEKLNDLAVIAQANGRDADARALLTAALVLDPQRPDIRANLDALPTSAASAEAPNARTSLKESAELSYWRERKDAEGTLSNDHYQWFYTQHFGLPPEFYAGKRMLDVGCGPRGSLEWAHDAVQRVGLDPLADSYRALGADAHAMQYVASGAEQIPFADGHFDVVATINSLDHVESLEATIAELGRVLRPGGLLLLATDVNHDPTPCEPHDISWDIIRAFEPECRVVDERHFEKDPEGMYASLMQARAYDHSVPGRRYGILSAKLEKLG